MDPPPSFVRFLFADCRITRPPQAKIVVWHAILGGRLNKGAPIAPHTKPRLPRGVRLAHNEAQGGWVLLAPERIFKADAIAAEILKRCTGEATLEAIVDDLAAAFQAPRERVLADVTALLGGLAEKKLLEL
jgi:pyrroloquinoline quinone biosynthesis protein D